MTKETSIKESVFGRNSISVVGKIFLAGIAAWLVGRGTGLRVRGTPDEIEVLKNALVAARGFQDELDRPGATIQSVMDKLQLKNAAAQEFTNVLGIPFPL